MLRNCVTLTCISGQLVSIPYEQNNFLRLLVRYERSVEVYWAFVILAFILICLNRILK